MPVLDHTIALAAVMVSRVVESHVHMSFNHCTFAPDSMTGVQNSAHGGCSKMCIKAMDISMAGGQVS